MLRILLIAIVALFTFEKQLYAKNISSIKVYGNKRFNEKTIIGFSGLKINQKFDKHILNNTLKRIYETENFSDVSVVSTKKNNIEIIVSEAPIIGDIFFTGDSKHFDEKEVKKMLLTKSRHIYTKSRIKFDTERLQMTLKKSGFLNASVTSKVVFLDDGSVDVIFNIDEGTISVVNNIIIRGNKYFKTKKIKDVIKSKKIHLVTITQNSSGFIENNIGEDIENIENFYKNNGFAKAKVIKSQAKLDKKKYNIILFYSIDEGKRYTFGNSKIVTSISKFENDNEIKKIIKIKKGKKFVLNKIDLTVDKIKRYLRLKGYDNVTPTYKLIYDESGNSVDIEYYLNVSKKTYINKIRILGNYKTKNNVILRELMIHEGDVYSNDKIKLSQNRLYMLGYFKNVEVKEVLIPNSDLIDLEVIVEEQFFGRINFSVGYSSYFGLIGSVSLSINNFLGRGFGLNVGFERSGFMENYLIGFFNPYMFSDKRNIGFGANVSFSRFGNIGGSGRYIQYFPYKGWNSSVNFNISFELLNRLIFTTTFGTSYYDYKVTESLGYKLYNQFLRTKTTNTIGFSISYNQMNRVIFATRGYALRYEVTMAGMNILNGQQFIKNSISTFENIPILNEDLYLHIEASGGILNSIKKNNCVGVENLFTLGGYSKMRGFDFFGIGPRIQRIDPDGKIANMYYAVQGAKYYYISIEIRSPLFIPKDYGIYFSTFVDAGSVWGLVNAKNNTSYIENEKRYKEIIRDTSKIRMSAGASITWQSIMFGEIGLYYAKPIIKQPFDTALEFGIRIGRDF